jgi:hypothetical protein
MKYGIQSTRYVCHIYVNGGKKHRENFMICMSDTSPTKIIDQVMTGNALNLSSQDSKKTTMTSKSKYSVSFNRRYLDKYI